MATAFAVAISTGAYAQSGGVAVDLPGGSGAAGFGGPTIGGDVTIEVETGNVTATASGADSTATNQIATVTDGNIGGDVSIEVETKDVSATASGSGSCAANQIGVIGRAPCR